MKPQSALADTAPSRDLGLTFWLSCLAALAVLLLLAVGAFYPESQTSPSAELPSKVSSRHDAVAPDAKSLARSATPTTAP